MKEVDPQSSSSAQSLFSAALLALVLLSCLSADMLARSKTLQMWTTALSSAFAAKNNTVFSDTGSFLDFEERVLLDEIPHTDYTKGGIYFFGTSNMKWAFSTWDLPPQQQEELHNYGIGASNHKDQLGFIRFLIERYGFLGAGTRDVVVLGVSFHLAHVDGPAGGYWAALLRRRGLYRLTDSGRMEPAAMNPVVHWLRVEQARSSGFIWNVGRLLQAAAKAHLIATKPIKHDATKYQAGWREFMGARWQQNMDEAMIDLQQTIDLVRSHGAQIKIVLLPQGSWMDGLPFGARYYHEVRDVCAKTGTPLIDLSHSLADNDFVDSNHLTVLGQHEFRNILTSALEIPGR
ncbi:hypothetical protein L6654_39640 [Bradyrhizobium sp. WYCCWR 13023]|uniref:Uncharacterized protein n=1 Tax=Bradyrhizobium zhengyangense TaxID=2911009 RepID=A0A9X1UJX6_9BRAD|nr:SGNH/GDSL hydrolase family protein [Bradyrhizobium zhengyangense]MCG2632717.1 hypothetical protein [Bradyrhizobium zhengyangense]